MCDTNIHLKTKDIELYSVIELAWHLLKAKIKLP